MADAARYARRDYCDPCAPYPYDCDPCRPPSSYCDPCAPYGDPYPPPWSYCDPCPPSYERRGVSEASDAINLKELRATLDAHKDDKLKKMRAALEEAESSEMAKESPELLDKLRKEFAHERSKAEAAIDAVIHDVKLARVAEAMRRKKWSRGAPSGRGY